MTDAGGMDAARLLGCRGADRLSDGQLVAILLAPSRNPSPKDIRLGRRLMNRFRHPSRLDRASLGELAGVGLSRAGASRIKAALELGRRSLSPAEASPRLSNSREVAGYFAPILATERVEKFCCALLDARNRLIRGEVVATGTVNACFIHPREVFRPAVAESACAVILVHNHPSGVTSPSDEDVTLTKRVADAGKVLGIRVLDHVIVGPGEHFSFLDAGLMTGQP